MIFALLFLAAAAASAHPLMLTMDEAVERALRNHPETRVARASVAVAAAQVAVARVLPAPQLRFSASNFDLDPETLEERNTIGMRFSIPRPWELGLKQQIARARQQGIEAEARSAEARVANEVRLAFRRTLLAQERARLAARVLQLRQNMKGTVLKQVAAGLKEADETDLAELALSEAEGELHRAAALAESEKRKLARLIEPLEPLEFSLAPDPLLLAAPEPVPATARAALAERAARLHSDVEAIASTCRQYELTESLAKRELYPWFSHVQVTHRTTPIADRGAWGFQVGVNLPFFRSAAKAEAGVARAQQNRCEVERQALETRIWQEVEESLANLEDLRRELAELERLRSGPGDRSLERARAALALGRADLLDVLNAEARVLSLRGRWLERRLQYAVLQAQLETALGERAPGNGSAAEIALADHQQARGVN